MITIPADLIDLGSVQDTLSKLGRYIVNVAKGLNILAKKEDAEFVVHAVVDENNNRVLSSRDISVIEQYCGVKTSTELLKKAERWMVFDEKTRNGFYDLATSTGDNDSRGLSLDYLFDDIRKHIEQTYKPGLMGAALTELDLAMSVQGKPKIYFNRPEGLRPK